jgi:hypothetical protein
MMELTINGTRTDLELAGVETFLQLIEHIERTVVVPPSVITKIVLNGEELDQGQEIGLGAFAISEIATLEIESSNQVELAHQALTDSQEYLPVVSSVLEEAAKTIREGKVDQGLHEASEALGIISDFGQVLEGIRIAFMIDLTQVRVDDYTLLDKLNDLGRLAREILDAAGSEEWVQFADLMEYELSPLLYEWMAVIPSLIQLLPEMEHSSDVDGVD